MSLMSKIATIDASIKAMKTNLGVSETAPLDEVVNATASGGGGGAGTPGVYKVATIEEMNALNVKEEDMCVVHSFMKTVLDENTTTLTGTLYMDEDVITSDTAISSTTSVSFRDANYDLDVRFQVSSTTLMIRVTDHADGYKTYQTRYDSTDGITYTYASGPREIPLSKEVTKAGTTWNNIFTKAVYSGDLSFSGLYQYLDGSWDYAKIGMDPSPSTVFSTSKYYSDSGIQQGTFIRANHKENYITVSNTEPEVKTKLWFKPLQKVDGTAVTKTYTTKDITNYARKNTTYEQFASIFNPTVVSTAVAAESTTANVNRPKAIVNNYLYILNNSYDSSNKAYKFNLSTGARSSIALCPFSSHTMWNSCTTTKVYGDYIYALCHLSNGGGIRRYSTTGNSWSTINTTDYDMGWYKYLFDYNGVWYIPNTSLTKCLVFNPSSSSGSVRNLPAEMIVGTYASYMLLFQEGNLAYLYNITDSRFIIWDFVGNTLVKMLAFDKAYALSDEMPSTSWNDEDQGSGFQAHYYSEDGRYAYSLDKDTDNNATISSPYNFILKIDLNVIKEAFEKEDALIVFNKGGIIKTEVPMHAPYLAGGVYNTDGYFYSYFIGNDKVVKYKLEDLLKCNLPVTSKYTLVFDTSKDTHNVLIGENERLLFNDIFIAGTRSYKDLVKGNVYIYDEILQDYRLLIENVVE